MAKAANINIQLRVVTEKYLTDVIGALLRATGWRPDRTHVCGCNPAALCAAHAHMRAAEHYR